MCCSPFYSDNLDKKKVRGKIVKNVIIVMGKYQEDHGGTKVLFHLAKRLNEAGCDTKIWPSKMPVSKFNLQYLFWIFRKLISFRLGEVIEEHTWPKHPIKYDLKVAKPADISGAVVIYTETINGNPLGADKVVRWILNYPGHGRNKRPRYDRAKEKFYLYYAIYKNKWVPDNFKILTTTFIDLHYYTRTNFDDRGKTSSVLVRKGKNRINNTHSNTSIEIDGLNQHQINTIFNKSAYLYSYDWNTAYNLFAQRCGCTPVLIGDGIEEFGRENTNNPDYFGFAFGTHDIARAQSQKLKAVDLLEKLNDTENNQFQAFLKDIMGEFSNTKCHQ